MKNWKYGVASAAALVAISSTLGALPPGTPEAEGAMSDERPSAVGPDVIVGDLNGVASYGSSGGISAFAIGTTSCNIGTMRLDWHANTNRHPVIGQNVFRYKVVEGVGRFEHIGQGWLKHGFYALSQSLCTPCNDPTDGTQLGVGCSDPYSASLNGDQSRLGPRSQVNVVTGYYPFPVTGIPPAAATIGRRVQIRNSDLDPTQNAGALFFAEGQYVTWDEPQWGNNHNNSSYRRVTISGSGSNYTMALAPGSTTVREKPAIYAWRDVCDPQVRLSEQLIRSDGLIVVGSRVTKVAHGVWAYEYAVQNVTSDRCAGSFSVPLGCGVSVSSTGFNASFSHSGEPYSNDPWVVSIAADSVSWATAQTHAQNPNANALRWGTMNTYRFRADRPARNGAVTIGMFKPGSPTNVAFEAPVPAPLADFNLDGQIDFFDYLDFVHAYGVEHEDADVNYDGQIDFGDYLDFIEAFSRGC